MGMKKPGLLFAAATMASSLGGPVRGSAQEPRELPAGVTDAMVLQGKELFQGQALCFACHGADASGGTGPNLADEPWLHEVKTFEALVKLITLGINNVKSVTGQIMPAKGGSAISVLDIRAVAAYVWSIAPGSSPQ